MPVNLKGYSYVVLIGKFVLEAPFNKKSGNSSYYGSRPKPAFLHITHCDSFCSFVWSLNKLELKNSVNADECHVRIDQWYYCRKIKKKDIPSERRFLVQIIRNYV